MEEARKAGEVLGVHVRENLNMPNRRLFDSFEARVALAKVFRRHKPKVVVGFGGKTVMGLTRSLSGHADHRRRSFL